MTIVERSPLRNIPVYRNHLQGDQELGASLTINRENEPIGLILDCKSSARSSKVYVPWQAIKSLKGAIDRVEREAVRLGLRRK